MSGIWLQHPEWLGAAVAVLAAVGVALVAVRADSRRRLRRLLGERIGRREHAARGDLAIFAALALVAVALLGPRIATREVELSRDGIDLVALVDVSRSMDAADLPPSRLARARRVLSGLLPELAPGDRAALAVFAGRGVLLTPLTGDQAALSEMLPAVDTGLMDAAGSELGAGVEAASRAFDDATQRRRVLLVLSDGETGAGLRDTGEVAARRAALRVVAVAFGSEAGATIPDHGAPLRDADGRIVVSRRRTSALAHLARVTGGELLLADAWGEVDRAQLLAALHRGLEGARRDGGRDGPEPAPRETRVVASVRPFAALAALLLLVEALPRGRRRSALSQLVLLCVGVSVGVGAASGEDGARVRALFARALAAAEVGDLAQAEHDLRAASLLAQAPPLAALAHYDLGVLALGRGELAVARDHFFEALALAPGDREARFNAEWTLRELAQRQPAGAGPRDAEQGEREARDRDDDPGSRTEPVPDPPVVEEPRTAEIPDGELPVLGPSERARWLERVRDDPGRSLRALAGAAPSEPSRRRGEIGW